MQTQYLTLSSYLIKLVNSIEYYKTKLIKQSPYHVLNYSKAQNNRRITCFLQVERTRFLPNFLYKFIIQAFNKHQK